jgi:hypothetical protein
MTDPWDAAVKKAVRTAAGVGEGDEVDVELVLLEG